MQIFFEQNQTVLSPLFSWLRCCYFFAGKETLAKNFLIELYKNLTVEVLSSDNDSIRGFNALTDLCAEIGVRLAKSIFANHERASLDIKKQEEEISKKYNFLMTMMIKSMTFLLKWKIIF